MDAQALHAQGWFARFRRIRVAAAVLGAAGLAGAAGAQTLPAGFIASTVTTGISGPTAMAIAPDQSVYMCQQNGQLKVWQAGTTSTVATFTVDSAGERGLIGVAVDPAFATNRFLYVHYTIPTAPIHNSVRRITLNAPGNAMVSGSEVVLIDMNNLSAGNHNGGAIHFGPDGKLYIGVGENAVSSNSQSIANLLGKILRINADPANPIPTDNPTSFPGITGTPTGNNRAIWAVGLRNPFTFAFQPGTGRMFINDVGNATWEEVNDGLAGRNYGWPGTEGFFAQASFPNFTLPLMAYRHSNGALNQPPEIGNFTGPVITGGAFYNPPSPNFPRSYQNKYFFGDSYASFFRTFDVATGTGEAFATGAAGVVDLGIAADGTLLYLARNTGALMRVTYTGTSGVCCAADGACTLSNGINCTTGSFIWGTVSCSPQPCVQPTGACCDGSACTLTLASACAAATQHFAGVGSTCNAAGASTTPCCKADFDHDGALVVSDIFQFLAAWFAGDVRADFNADASESVNDIFDFLAAWFVGCA